MKHLRIFPALFLVLLIGATACSNFNNADLIRRAEQGDVEAQHLLGVMYHGGNGGVSQDYQKALKWFTMAAEQGDTGAQSEVSAMYYLGNGMSKNYVPAYMWANLAAANGNKLAVTLRDSAAHKMTISEIEKAKELSRECKAKNYKNCYSGDIAHSKNDVAHSKDFRKGMDAFSKKDYVTVLEKWVPLAEGGDTKVQYLLGVMYAAEAEGAPTDYKKALKWLTRAADQGHVEAQHLLGLMYVEGEIVTKDYKKALKWLTRAAKQEYAPAQFNLGVMYAEGQGVPKDYKKALELARLSAEKGNADAQILLGAMHVTGRGVPEDSVLAYMWIELAGNEKKAVQLRALLETMISPEEIEKAKKLAKECKAKSYQGCHSGDLEKNSDTLTKEDYDEKELVELAKELTILAERGDAKAQYTLGAMHYEGLGVTQDYKKTLKWYISAAEQGYAKAQVELGAMYFTGKSIPKDFILAYMWISLAAENGSEAAVALRSIAADQMVVPEIEKAKKLAKECKVKSYKSC